MHSLQTAAHALCLQVLIKQVRRNNETTNKVLVSRDVKLSRAYVSDSPQVQCIQSYSAQEPDELSTEMADILNLLERTDDGV